MIRFFMNLKYCLNYPYFLTEMNFECKGYDTGMYLGLKKQNKKNMIMERTELLKKTEQRIEELNQKILDIREKLEEEGDVTIKGKVNKAIDNLEDIKDEIQEQYTKLKMQESDQEEFTEVEKNIYNSFESFNDAFKDAGLLFKTNK